ncbi:MAG: MFS transporter, partial [Terriglobia bacterium]
AGSAMGLINAIGGLGGYFGPLAVGYSEQRTGSFVYAFCILGAALLASSALTLLFRCSGVTAKRSVSCSADL